MDALSLNFFSSLPKSGKPSIKGSKREWTVLATIIQNQNLVVALGTGTKCLPASENCNFGSKVCDSHAEVVAKRSFQKYLFSQLDLAIYGEKSCLEYNKTTRKYRVDPSTKFSMYVSYAPCGDASMSTLNDKTEQEMQVINEKKRRHAEARQQDAKRFKGVIRGRDHLQLLGMPRTKPGRADSEHTNCMSCTDKLLRWSCLGLNGSLLSLLLEPVFIECLLVGEGLDLQDQDRFLARVESLAISPFCIILSTLRFSFSKNVVNKPSISSDSAICWNLEFKNEFRVLDKDYVQVIVNGRKQGSSRKADSHEARRRSRVGICKAEFLERFIGTIRKLVEAGIEHVEVIPNIEDLKRMTYRDIKLLNVKYKQQSDAFKDRIGGWVDKGTGLEDFLAE